MNDNDFDLSEFNRSFNFKKQLWPNPHDSGNRKVDYALFAVEGKSDKEVVAIFTFDKNVKGKDRAQIMATNRCFLEIADVCDKNGWDWVGILFM